MRNRNKAASPLPGARIISLAVALLLAGCNENSGVGRTVPVSGKLTLDRQPFAVASTIIVFKPDATRGNNSPLEPSGTVDEQGTYTVRTKGKKRAPPGWYKVVVTATHPRSEDEKGALNHRPGPRSLLDARYGQVSTTPLAIEVVEEPAAGAYDLGLSSD